MLAALPLAAAPPKIIFDTDSGFFGDDGAALVMLLRSPDRVAVQGVTVVSGNVWAPQGAEYMFHILKILGREDLPLYLGARAPLLHTAAQAAREENIEFRGAFAGPAPRSRGDLQPPFGGRFAGLAPQKENGVDFLIRTLEGTPAGITVLALGPMTNLAVALCLRPDLEARISRLVFMGGNVRVPGNASPAAEFNFWFDPEAAAVVLRSAIPEKIMFGLDICNRAPIRRPEFDRITAVQTPITELFREDMGNRYPGFLRNPDAIAYLWDELAAAYLLDPAFVTRSESLYLDVETRPGPRYGATLTLDRALAPSATPVRVMLDLDFPRVFALYKDLLTR